ncbi:MAG: hypothetical protein ACLRYY_12165 [Anaerobutyricum soehngenii]
MFLFSNMMLNNTKEMIQKVGERPTVSSFPILWSDNLFLMLVFFTVIWMFSDAPFFDRMTTFLLVRSGKIIFAIAHIAYIVILSAVIPIIIYIAETVFLPYVQGNNWGNFWGTLAQTDIIAQVQGRITIELSYFVGFSTAAGYGNFGKCMLFTLLYDRIIFVHGKPF